MNTDVTGVSVPEGIAGHLQGLIRRGELGPGDRLPSERQLAEELGVARVSLREATKQLQSAGYVEVRRGRFGGTFVTSLNRPLAEWRASMREQADSLNDLIVMRVAVESHAASLAAEYRSDVDLDAMREALDLQAAATNRVQVRSADSKFHDAVAKASASSRLRQAVQEIRGEFFTPTDMLVFPSPDQEDRLQHEAVFKEIRDQNPQGAAAQMRYHIEQTREVLLQILFDNAPHSGSSG